MTVERAAPGAAGWTRGLLNLDPGGSGIAAMAWLAR